jgi:hypothetical protein
VTNSDVVLAQIRESPELAAVLRSTFEFDVTRGEQVDAARLASGASLECIAGDFSGGTFFLCGDRISTRPMLYASSEGQAGLIGANLVDALEIIVGLPCWWDCLKFSGGGDLAAMEVAAGHLEDDSARWHPDISVQRAHVAAALSLHLAPRSVLLARLRDAALSTEPDHVFTDDTGEYETLVGAFPPSRNRSWR